MYILAFETSCDDTSIAIFKDDQLIAMDTASQIKIHNKTGWVVPEVAAREHANAIFDVLQNTLNEAKLELTDINHIAVTSTPGLMPSLLTGLTVARTLWNIHKVPVLEVNHIQAHIFANFLERKKSDIEFPLVCLTVSGWHNEIYHMTDMWDFNRVGGTTDDAAGEAFDKVAKMMWLGYPGWPIVSQLADTYNPKQSFMVQNDKKLLKATTLFPRVWLVKDEFDFSFSGLKSAVKREIDKRTGTVWKVAAHELTKDDQAEISYEFQNAVNEVLSYKLINAAKKLWVKTVLLAWWVSANDNLRDKIAYMSEQKDITFLSPTKKVFCMDNAAMIWILAYYKILDQKNWV